MSLYCSECQLPVESTVNGQCSECRRDRKEEWIVNAIAGLIFVGVVLPVLAYLAWVGLQIENWSHTSDTINWWPW